MEIELPALSYVPNKLGAHLANKIMLAAHCPTLFRNIISLIYFHNKGN